MKFPEKPPKNTDVLTKDNLNLLLEMMGDTELIKKLNQIDKEYYYWDRFKYQVKSIKYDPGLIWLFNKFSREKSISRVKISNLEGFEFKYNTPSKILKYLHEFDLHIGGILEGRAIIPEEDKNRYLISSIMEEAIASSQLEGAATTREIAKEMLRNNRKPTTHSEKMILNNYLTMQKAIEYKYKKLTKDIILELHSIISKDTLPNIDFEGKFRETNNVNVVDGLTGAIFYCPPDYNRVEELMSSFCDFANCTEDDNFIHPIIRGIILHFLIGYIHPFVDGNGRTARALFYWYLLSKGYWLIEYMSISKIIIRAPAKYGRSFLFSEYDENDITYFIHYNLRSMDLSLKSLQKHIRKKVKEKQYLFNIIKKEDINERQAELLKKLLIDGRRRLTIKEVQTTFGVVYQTARTDLLHLQNLGYITGKKMGKKLIFFKSDDFEEKLQDLSENISQNTLF
jgi:Fic family protein